MKLKHQGGTTHIELTAEEAAHALRQFVLSCHPHLHREAFQVDVEAPPAPPAPLAEGDVPPDQEAAPAPETPAKRAKAKQPSAGQPNP